MTVLRQEDPHGVWHDREALCLRGIANKHVREEVQQQCHQHALFAEVEKILLVDADNVITRILCADMIIHQ